MRYAIIRGGEGLPATEDQRQALARLGCDVVLQEEQASPEGQRWILQRIRRLERGDEVCVCALQVLQLSTLELFKLLRKYVATGVIVRLAYGDRVETLDARTSAEAVLGLLCEHERQRPSGSEVSRRERKSGRALTAYQLRYARRLLRAGTGLREIGLLFGLAPREVQEQLESTPDAVQRLDGVTSNKKYS